MILILVLLAAAVAGLWYHFASDTAVLPPRDHMISPQWPRTIAVTPAPDIVTRQSTTDKEVITTSPVVVEAFQPPVAPPQRQVALAPRQEQRAADPAQEQAERAAVDRRAAGQDAIIPLDRETPVNVGGYTINVMIHENDTTSFDVWINGLRAAKFPSRRESPEAAPTKL